MTILKAGDQFFRQDSVVLWEAAGERLEVRLTGGHVVYLDADQAVAFIRAMGNVRLIDLGKGVGPEDRDGRAPESGAGEEPSQSG
jgi:hypothetical protein